MRGGPPGVSSEGCSTIIWLVKSPSSSQSLPMASAWGSSGLSYVAQSIEKSHSLPLPPLLRVFDCTNGTAVLSVTQASSSSFPRWPFPTCHQHPSGNPVDCSHQTCLKSVLIPRRSTSSPSATAIVIQAVMASHSGNGLLTEFPFFPPPLIPIGTWPASLGHLP